MPGRIRSLPSRPSLRYLKIEAKRRAGTGEFATLHEAQDAVAAEHGLANWAALKRLVAAGSGPSGPGPDGPAVPRLMWMITRFRDAGTTGWTPPDADELRAQVSDQALATYPPGELIAMVAPLAPVLRGEPVVVDRAPLAASVMIGGWRLTATVEAQPPHKLTDVRAVPVRPVPDPRLAAPPPPRRSGDVPAYAVEIADWALAELGLVGLVLAGGGPGRPAWSVAAGWADLDRPEPLDAGHRFPVPGVTALVTATAVLRLVAAGRFGLDRPANDHLRTVRLADASVTVRELLSHTAGVANPDPARLFAGEVPDLVTLTGPVVDVGAARGTVRPSNGGYAVLGQLIEDVTGSRYAEAATDLVLAPLGMTGAWFPDRPPGAGAGANPAGATGRVTGYDITPEGSLTPAPDTIATIPAVAGLRATPADLVRLGTGWASLLPAALAGEALTPQTEPAPNGYRVGLGWLITPHGDIAAHGGTGAGFTTSLLLRVRDGEVVLALTNRIAPLDPLHRRLLRAWSAPSR